MSTIYQDDPYVQLQPKMDSMILVNERVAMSHDRIDA